MSDLTHIAASVGPGSFTGIRIGVSTARALGQSLDLPCISVPTLEAMMRGALDNIEKSEKTVPVFHICTVINARRHQTYGAVWTVMSREGGQEKAFELTETLPQGQHMIEEVMDKVNGLDGPVYMTGDGVDAYGDIIREGTADIHIMPEDLRYQDAAAVAEVALGKLTLEETVVYDKLLPDYMRKTEAEMKLEEGTLSKRISEAMV